jgi:CHAT domain-containing protein
VVPGRDGAERTGPHRGESFARLLGSRREAMSILELAPADRRRLAIDFAASRGTATGGELGRYRIVHFATHGVLDDVFPELSGIVLSLVDERGAEQDGFLRLHEIADLELAPELVVLSACQTALGKEVAGEGLLGFNRAFMYAGAPRVVSTLWRVDDRATAELMRRFYVAMFAAPRLSPAAALRAAQLSLAGEPRWRSPYYWSGFVLQGEWR